MAANSLHAQPSGRIQWWGPTNERIRAIYERGELRGNRFDAEWLSDSSGFVVRERNSDSGETQRAVYDVVSGNRKSRPDAEQATPQRDSKTSLDGRYTLQYQGRDVVVREVHTGKTETLLRCDEERDSMFRSLGWSPDGRRVVFVDHDETDVRLRSVLKPTDPSYPNVDQHRFARVGEKISKLRVGVVDVDTHEIQWLPIESPEEGFYLGQVEWAGNSREVLVETMSRFRDTRTFLLVDIDAGTVTQIFHETNDAWAVGSQEKNSGLLWVRSGNAFIVISEQDGWRHAFLYDRKGEQLAVLTPGDYDIVDRGQVDEANGWFYFYASPENATQKFLYYVPLDGNGDLTPVSPRDQPGTHDYVFSPDVKWAFHTYSTFDTPPVTDLVELPSHRTIRMLEDNADLLATSRQWIAQPTEFLQLEIEDGVSFDAWLMKPNDFDPSKKYPVFIYVYGEPYAQTVLDEWGAAQSHFHRVVADMGYLVVSIDNRGTPAPKGAAWRRSIFGSLGPLSTDDQVVSLDYSNCQRQLFHLDGWGERSRSSQRPMVLVEPYRGPWHGRALARLHCVSR
ncbi:MAG: DPP IV N-terminal domain-containing protein [Pirellulaceae bacterium]